MIESLRVGYYLCGILPNHEEITFIVNKLHFEAKRKVFTLNFDIEILVWKILEGIRGVREDSS